jgi:phospholipase A1
MACYKFVDYFYIINVRRGVVMQQQQMCQSYRPCKKAKLSLRTVMSGSMSSLCLLGLALQAQAETTIAPSVASPSLTVSQSSQEQIYSAKSPQACVSFDSNAERLSCYDSFFSRPMVVTAPTSNDHITTTVAAQPLAAANPVEATKNAVLSAIKAPDFNPTISLLDRRWELSDEAKLGTFHVTAYKPVYILPVFYSSKVNKLPTSPNPENKVATKQDIDHAEGKFQLSLKTKAIEGLIGDHGDLWLGYTQSSRWQVYNSEQSRPFRETNYEPEASLMFKTNYNVLGLNGRLLGLSLNHQSNGRSLPLSRSWNRAILNLGFERDNFALMIRPWYRFDEDAKDNDNADIDDYMGHGDIQAFYKYKENEFSLMLRNNFKFDSDYKGAVQFDWAFPIKGSLRGHVQVFDGYGESLIDYNHRATYVGLGVSMLNWY